MNPHAQPYAFPAGGNRALADYLTQTTQYNPATGCLEWLGKFDRDGIAIAAGAVAKHHGTRQVTRLAWVAHHGRKLDKATHLVRPCGNPRCVHPLHLKEATPNDLWRGDPDSPDGRASTSKESPENDEPSRTSPAYSCWQRLPRVRPELLMPRLSEFALIAAVGMLAISQTITAITAIAALALP